MTNKFEYNSKLDVLDRSKIRTSGIIKPSNTFECLTDLIIPSFTNTQVRSVARMQMNIYEANIKFTFGIWDQPGLTLTSQTPPALQLSLCLPRKHLVGNTGFVSSRHTSMQQKMA